MIVEYVLKVNTFELSDVIYQVPGKLSNCPAVGKLPEIFGDSGIRFES